MALAAVILDVDGTLIDSNRLHVEAFRRAFEAFGYRVPADRINREMGKGGDQLIPSLLGQSAFEKDGKGLGEQEPKEFKLLAKERGLKVFPGVRELLAELRRRELKIVVATSSGKAQLAVLSELSGLDVAAEADVLVNADDIENSKPAPDLVAAAVSKSKLSPAQCVMVGDTPYDAESAKHAGVVTIGVLCGGVGMSASSLHRAGARLNFADPADLLAHLDAALAAVSPSTVPLTQQRLEEMMEPALQAAKEGMAAGEAPIGAAIFRGDGTLLATGYNRLNATLNKTMHAEMDAFARAAGQADPDVKDLILVSTLEPCVMCTGAAMEAAVDTIVYGLRAPADAGTGRVIPPSSPDTQVPRIVGKIRAGESLDLLRRWYRGKEGLPQARYVRQLLELHGQIS